MTITIDRALFETIYSLLNLTKPVNLTVSVEPPEGLVLDAALKDKLNNAIRVALSPRFVPNAIFQVAEIPRTLSGKKQELPIKKLLLGQPIEKVVNQDAMANPGCLKWYVAFAAEHQGRS
jgi:acetoacetyl-CoA synthetase